MPDNETKPTTIKAVKSENTKNSDKNLDLLRRKIEDELNEEAVKSEQVSKEVNL